MRATATATATATTTAAERRSGTHPRTTLRALAVANARYWRTVAPEVPRELAHWRQPARAIADPALRRLAVAKLADEHFNAEVAATLATLAPRARRAQAIRAMVALELLFDYLDGRTERPAEDPLGQGERLFEPFIAAIDELTHPSATGDVPADWGYITALSGRTRRSLHALPGAARVLGVARDSARRCAQAQTRLHAAAALGDEQLRGWAAEAARSSGLEWRAYAAGCASSVLAMHALIAAAADPATSEQDARRIDAAYMAIGAVITILDSVVDESQDAAQGQAGFIRLYEPRELEERLCELIREALGRAAEAPHGAHHTMTLVGTAAYYTTHAGAREPRAQEIARVVRRELSPTIWPTIGVMRCWRGAKWARGVVRGVPGESSRSATVARSAGRDVEWAGRDAS